MAEKATPAQIDEAAKILRESKAKKSEQPSLPLDAIKPFSAQEKMFGDPLANSVTPALKPADTLRTGFNAPQMIGDKKVNVNLSTDSGVKPAITPTGTASTGTSNATTSESKPEEKKGGFNWLAALADTIGSGAHGYAGREHKGGYIDMYAENEAKNKELEAQRQMQLDKMKGMMSGGAGAASSPIGGYAPIAGVTPTQATINKASDLAGAKDGFNIAMQKFENAIAQHGKGTILPSAENQMLDSARADVISSIKGMKQLGTLDAGVERLVDKYLPATGGMNTLVGSNKEQMQKIISDMRLQQNKALSSTMNRYGFQETATPSGAGSTAPQTVAYMVEGKRYDIPADKEAAFKAAKPMAKKVQ